MKYLILAGGVGARIWPLSRRLFPKLFLKLTSSMSPFQETISRVKDEALSNVFVVTTEELKFIVYDQILKSGLKIPKENVIVEPVSKNTLAAISYGISGFDEDDIITVLSSDHFIQSNDIFLKYLKKAKECANKGYIITLGIKADSPVIDYGYIKKGELIDAGANLYKSESFKEKPTLEEASRYYRDGSYLWNAGIFIFQKKTFVEDLGKYHYETEKLLNFHRNKNMDFKIYDSIPNISIDKGLLENSDKIAVLECDMVWSDLYSFQSIYNVSEKDNQGNVVKIDNNKYYNENSKNLLICGDKRVIATIDLENIAIIDTEDALLVGKMSGISKVKNIVETLQFEKMPEVDAHLTVYKPWGSYTILQNGSNFKVKELYIRPKKKISLQYHNRRSETWTVVAGVGEVTKGDETIILNVAESVFIPVAVKHRLFNPSDTEDLRIIEVQTGDYLEEDDIIRIEDEFDRK
ncbi:MAG TPA: mannose-1-phosphate guanylyltransferase/mannose-6-phosphate isomerase [Spirochaetota bacterium]|jgi:mannose-1-phosphate guanylyltransferase/mannose-6-phosphate isomerase|nr:MAG: Alginate biosynthesis protein AlgA [Spirochaetes bacterium ADurb.Bin133]HPY86527.1 mannose-1-phosphate guanylyltransferase/mannose-6-phosphate isomerase [Spirochaetota bacterium]